jgi:quinol monooxygenase YgiN
MVRLAVALPAYPQQEQPLVEAFRYLMVGTLLEPGCLSCSAWADPDSTVHYVEEWATEGDLRQRIRSDRFTSLLALLESAKEPPAVRIEFVEKTCGLEYVSEVRQGAA